MAVQAAMNPILLTKYKQVLMSTLSRNVATLSNLQLPSNMSGNTTVDEQQGRKYRFNRRNNTNNCIVRKPMSTVSCFETSTAENDDGPFGELFRTQTELGSGLVGQTGCIHRTFGPRDNTDTILATGGEALAAHASFDPNYKRAQGWIRQHAVGPAVLSPILLQGLIGSLSEAAFPEGVLVSQSMTQLKPLIVGVAVKAKIEVIDVVHSTKTMNEESGEKNGYMITLRTDVSRVRDDELIVEGTKLIWIPDYENM